MNITGVTAVYFSPTGGTKTYARALAERLGTAWRALDLTTYDTRLNPVLFSPTELVILGAPVYAGRLPMLENGIFDRLRGQNTPAVFLVSYGNRAFEDALLELKETCEARGFCGVAAGAFIAPHTYSAKAGAGRPNADDLAAVDAFAQRIKEKLALKTLPPLHVPGNHPFRDGKTLCAPDGDATCTGCGLCAQVCPTRAIAPQTPRQTDAQICISCFACVKACPAGARDVHAPPFHQMVQNLEKTLLSSVKQPALFL